MNSRYEYSVEQQSVDIQASDFITRFRDEIRFIEYCRECPNYGRLWSCPPFDYDTSEILSAYKFARIIATRITPVSMDIPLDSAQDFLRPERVRIERELLRLEKQYGGRAFSFVGKCLYCGDKECTRPCGLPCRHPDKVRPSLEAFGFDLSKTLSELFGWNLLWSRDNHLPPYLILVAAIFHNSEELFLSGNNKNHI